MHILKAVLFSFLYILFVELAYLWQHITNRVSESYHRPEHFDFFAGLIIFCGALMFIYRPNHYRARLPQPTSLNWYGASIFFGLFFVFLQIPLNVIYGLATNSGFLTRFDFKGVEILLNLDIWSTILLCPIAEELIFREFIQKNLQGKMPVNYAIVITSALFAALHLPYHCIYANCYNPDPHHAYIAFFGSLILGSIYSRSKSIGPPILMHVIWNTAIAFVG